MDLSIFAQYGPILIRGFAVTIFCWLFGTIFGMALGLVIALIQRYGPKPLRWLVQVYIEVIRGTPFLVQLFVLYYGGPMIGLRLDALPALANELILLVKASSLVSVVGILEITRSSQALAATTFRPLEVYLAAACIYLAINLCLAALGRYLEHRMAI